MQHSGRGGGHGTHPFQAGWTISIGPVGRRGIVSDSGSTAISFLKLVVGYSGSSVTQVLTPTIILFLNVPKLKKAIGRIYYVIGRQNRAATQFPFWEFRAVFPSEHDYVAASGFYSKPPLSSYLYIRWMHCWRSNVGVGGDGDAERERHGDEEDHQRGRQVVADVLAEARQGA